MDIRKLREQDRVDGRLLVAEKHLLATRDGRPFLRLRLMNRTGSIEAVLWDDAEAAYRLLDRSDHQVVEISGVVVLYQQERRIRLKSVTPAPGQAPNLDAFLPTSERNPEEMAEELHKTIRKVANPFLRRLLETIFRDPEIWESFRNTTAAKRMHHAYRGGLLEHTLSLARLVLLAHRNYPFLDRDLLLAGALVHDLGKARELRADAGFDYTDEGRLVGHIVLGLEILQKKIDSIPDFPPSLAASLKHLVVSHHGEVEFGSPRQPMSLEAICLHGLDDLDAKLWGVHDFIKQEAGPGKRWTSFHRVHQRYFYIPESFPAERPSQEASPDKPEKQPPNLFARDVAADTAAKPKKL